MTSIKSANIHITNRCNYRCKFCFSSDRGCACMPNMPAEFWKGRIEDLVIRRGIEKINFAGGEPLLYPGLLECVRYAKSLGATTSVVTNGSLADLRFFREFHDCLDWIGVSIDSTDDYTEVVLGRHAAGCRHLENAKVVSDYARDYEIGLKLNVTVNRLCIDEDFHEIIARMDPLRVKFIQVSWVPGMNDAPYHDLSITEATFGSFKDRHSGIVLSSGCSPVFETESLVYNSYLMLDCRGNVRINTENGYRAVDYWEYWSDPCGHSVDLEKYIERGALYDWNLRGEGVYRVQRGKYHKMSLYPSVHPPRIRQKPWYIQY